MFFSKTETLFSSLPVKYIRLGRVYYCLSAIRGMINHIFRSFHLAGVCIPHIRVDEHISYHSVVITRVSHKAHPFGLHGTRSLAWRTA